MWSQSSSHPGVYGIETSTIRKAPVASAPDQQMRPDPAGVGSRITDARKARGLNRNQLARKVGTSWALVDRWEKGRTVPSVESLHRLSEALGVGVDRLLGTSPTQTAMDNEVLAEFFRSHAPRDLTEEERRWLQSAPVGPQQLTAKDYAEILRVVRAAKHARRAGSPADGKVVEFSGDSD